MLWVLENIQPNQHLKTWYWFGLAILVWHMQTDQTQQDKTPISSSLQFASWLHLAQPLDRVLKLRIRRHLRETLGLNRIIKHLIRASNAARSTKHPDKRGVRWRLKLHHSHFHGLVHLDGLVQLLVIAETHVQFMCNKENRLHQQQLQITITESKLRLQTHAFLQQNVLVLRQVLPRQIPIWTNIRNI